MTVHYHGTPFSPRSALMQLAGKHICVPFSDHRDDDWALAHAQSVMHDNGAYTAFTQKRQFDLNGYLAWLEPRLAHPHWAVIPDVIDGTVEQQRELIAEWPYGSLGFPVWHTALPFDWLLELSDKWERICFGSSGQYWQIGSDSWCRRIDAAFDALAQRHQRLPHIHMLRGMNMAGDRWPFASVDSVNVARNYKDSNTDPERMARRIDAVQCPVKWRLQPQQEALFGT